MINQRRKDQMYEETSSHFIDNPDVGSSRDREVVYVYSPPRVKKEPADETLEAVQVSEITEKTAGTSSPLQVPRPRYYYYVYQPQKASSRIQSSKVKPEGEQKPGDSYKQNSLAEKVDDDDGGHWSQSMKGREQPTKPSYILCDENGGPNAYHLPYSSRSKHRYTYPSLEYRQGSPRRSPGHEKHSPLEVSKASDGPSLSRRTPDWKEDEYQAKVERKDEIKIVNEDKHDVNSRKSGEHGKKDQGRRPYMVMHPGPGGYYRYPTQDELPPDVAYRYEPREYMYRPNSQNERYSPVRIVYTRDLAGKNYKLHQRSDQRMPETKTHSGHSSCYIPSKKYSETNKPYSEATREHYRGEYRRDYQGEYYNPPNVTLINRPESGEYMIYDGQDMEYPQHYNRFTPSPDDDRQNGSLGDSATRERHRYGSPVDQRKTDTKVDDDDLYAVRKNELNSESEKDRPFILSERKEHPFMEALDGQRREYLSPQDPVSRRSREPYVVYPTKVRPLSTDGSIGKRKYQEVYGRSRDYYGPSKVLIQSEDYRPRRCMVYQVPAYPGCCCPCCPCATVPRPEPSRPPPPPPPPQTQPPRVSPRPVPPQRNNPPLPQSPPTNNLKMIPYPRRRRNRTVYTNDQIAELEEVFKLRHYLDVDEKSSLAGKLKVRTENVEIWFKNRRAKWRREMKAIRSEEGEDGESEDSTVEDETKEDDQISNKECIEENDEDDDMTYDNSPLIQIEMKEVTEDECVYNGKESDDNQEEREDNDDENTE